MDKIIIGDIVDVCWDYIGSEFDLEVLYIPCANSDSWQLKRKDGTLIYINYFGRMVKK